MNLTQKNNNLVATIYNYANYPITASISVQAPPAFSVQYPNRSVDMQGNTKQDLNFNMSTPQFTNSRFPVVAAISYTDSNLHYSAIRVVTINFGGSSGGQSAIPSLFNIGIILIIVVIVALIALSIVKKKKNNGRRLNEKTNG